MFQSSWRQRWARDVPLHAAATVAVIGIGALTGWILDIAPLKSVLPGLVSMKPNTAVCFVLASAALYLACKRQYPGLRAACAAVLAVVGAVSLSEYLWHFDAGIDQLLFLDPTNATFPGRMAPITAFNFVLVGAMVFPYRFRAREQVADGLALVLCFGAMFAIVGYLYGVPLLYGSLRYTAMAIHTGFCFLMLSLGFLFIPKEHGLGQIFRARTTGGVVVRRLVPLAILIPILVGGVVGRFNFVEIRLGVALVVLVNALLVVTSIWWLAHALDRSEMGREHAELASETDALTGIRNRRYFDHRLREEMQRCLRYSRPACLILLDVDHFKRVNDCYGHPAGDEVLRAIAQACEGNVRGSDVVCRYGGEEFAVLVPETVAEDALALARKLRALVASLTFEKIPVRVTISLGVAEFDDEMAMPDQVVAAADEALYLAKRMGRNQAQLYQGPVPELAGAQIGQA